MNELTGWKTDHHLAKIKPMEKIKLKLEGRVILMKSMGNYRQLKFMTYNLNSKVWTMQWKSCIQQIFITQFLCVNTITLGFGIIL